MSAQYVVNSAGERVSVILPIAEYEALLRYVRGERCRVVHVPQPSRIQSDCAEGGVP